MSPRRGILSGGNWLVDHVKLIDVWPGQEALANITSEYRGTGGAPFNVLVSLARLGAGFPLEACGVLGDDEEADWIVEVCRKYQIDVSRLTRLPDAPTSYTDVMTVIGTGRRTFFHQRGANASLTPSDLQLHTSSAALFHLGYLLLLDRLDSPSLTHPTQAAEVLDRAISLGFTTSLDVVTEESDRYLQLVLPVLPYVDLAFFNEIEAERTTQIKTRHSSTIDLNGVRDAAAALLRAGVRKWVIIHFPEGVVAARAEEMFFQPGLRVPVQDIAGATGAGDALAAGVLLGYHDSLPMPQCLIYGVAAAAASLAHPSATEGVLPIDECLAKVAAAGYQDDLWARQIG